MPFTGTLSDTAVLLIDPYNDFLHEKGKLYHLLADSIIETGTIKHLQEVVNIARASQIPVIYCMHQQTNVHSYDGWQNLNASQTGIKVKQVFQEGSFGAEYFEGLKPDFSNNDVVVSKHWNSSSFANTDLDYHLKKRGIKKLVLTGLIANTCLESTARYAYELDYDLTMLSDGTAGLSIEAKNVAVKLVWPLFANRVLTVREWAESLLPVTSESP